MNLYRSGVFATAGAVLLAGCIDLSTRQPASRDTVCSSNEAPSFRLGSQNKMGDKHERGMGHGGMGPGGMGPGRMDDQVVIGSTCNRAEMVDPGKSTYVPRIADASAADRFKARELLDGVNRFCRTHSAADIQSQWRAGVSKPDNPTHFYNPVPQSSGADPANPKAALIYDGKLDGVMFSGAPLPSLGSIPRAHFHDMTRPVEMVHVYCTNNLKDAFTPNRTIGVMADLRRLRDIVRPAILYLSTGQLQKIRDGVRRYAGNGLEPVAPVGTLSDGGPDPATQAMRTEIRHSLMLLTEHQLRTVWSLMRTP